MDLTLGLNQSPHGPTENEVHIKKRSVKGLNLASLRPVRIFISFVRIFVRLERIHPQESQIGLRLGP